ncbi:MAG: hypothetical protein IH797_07220, partial [Chloroflexi bacterium]|nr:hypothetical protein [Chloroflexota bacterium]
ANDLMLTNYESIGYAGDPEQGFQGGLNIFDVSDPHDPKHIHFWATAGDGIHRFTFDGRYAYLSATAEDYIGHIVIILDLDDPRKPEEVGRWWMPGRWQAGGEATPITTLDQDAGENSHRFPWFLPEGRHYLYLARVHSTGASDEHEIRLAGARQFDCLLSRVGRKDTVARYRQ